MKPHHPWALLGLAALCAMALDGSARAQQLIVFKDGFAIDGRIKQESGIITDKATGAVFSIPASGKPHYVDDGVRAIFFSPYQLAGAENDIPKQPDYVKLNLSGFTPSTPITPSEVEKIGDWNERWERTVTLNTLPTPTKQAGRLTVTQRISLLTPEVMCVTTHLHKWVCYYKTRELDPQVVRDLVTGFLDKKHEDKPFERQAKVCKFLQQAGFLEQAEIELNAMLKKYPEQKSAIEPQLDNIKRIQAVQFVEGLERSYKAGLHVDVSEKLARYAKMNLENLLIEKLQLKVQEIKNKYDGAAEKLKEARQLLVNFGDRAVFGKRDFYKDAAAAIVEELSQDNVDRLETFISQAKDFERALADKRKPDQSADEVMAFALTGWMRGSNAAERNPAVAIQQWEIRKALVDFQGSDDPGVRKKKLEWLKSSGISVDEVMQILRKLPPPDAPSTLPVKGATLQAPNGTSYVIQLPRGYHPGRAWPVMMVLHSSAEKPAEALDRWSDLAAQNGYILVAPRWAKGFKVEYQYTAVEHAAVLDTLRDLRRRFQIDSDRVFLFGLEQGGEAAFDIGLAHPDQFAGVIPMGAVPRYYAYRYWSNARFLEMYIVYGDAMSLDHTKHMQAFFKDFLLNDFPGILVQYKGRKAEWFGAEAATIFDWMNRKKRAFPIRDLGIATREFKTQRVTDNQFYWLSTSFVLPGRLAWPAVWDKQKTKPATLAAAIFSADNSVRVDAHGVGQVTIWFAPKMLNYGEDVAVKLNDAFVFRKKIVPSLETLLENLQQTGDRQRLYFAKLDFKV